MPTPAHAAVQRLNKPIPTVFTVVTDPVEGGFVQSLARPVGIHGHPAFEYSIGGKWFETHKELDLSLSRVLVLLFHDNYTSRGLVSAIDRLDRNLAWRVVAAPV